MDERLGSIPEHGPGILHVVSAFFGKREASLEPCIGAMWMVGFGDVIDCNDTCGCAATVGCPCHCRAGVYSKVLWKIDGEALGRGVAPDWHDC